MDFTDYEIIEKYLNNELNSEELHLFKKELESNKEFRTDVNLYKEINTSLESKYTNLKKETELKKSLNSAGYKYFEKDLNKIKNETKTISLRSNFLKLMSVAAIFAIGFFLLKPQADLYIQFAEHSALEIQVKGTNQGNLLKAADFFNTKKYKESIPLFNTYLKEKNDSEIKLFLSIAQLETGDLDKSLKGFTEIYNLNNSLKNKATWYLALTHLKKNEKSKAKDYLRKIPETSSYYTKANKLLKKI